MDDRRGDLPGDDQLHPTGSQYRHLRDNDGRRDGDGSEDPSRRMKKRQIIAGLSFLIMLLILMPFVGVLWGSLVKPLALSALVRLLSILRFIVMTSAVSAGIITTSHHNSDEQSSTKGNSIPRRNYRNDEKGKGLVVVNSYCTTRISSAATDSLVRNAVVLREHVSSLEGASKHTIMHGASSSNSVLDNKGSHPESGARNQSSSRVDASRHTLMNAESRTNSVLHSRVSHPEADTSGSMSSLYQNGVPSGVGESTEWNSWESLGSRENAVGLQDGKPETSSIDSVKVDPSGDLPKNEQADLSTHIGRRNWTADNGGSPRWGSRNEEQGSHNEQRQNLQTDQQSNYYESTHNVGQRRSNGRGNLSPSARSKLRNVKHSRSEDKLDELLEKDAMKPSICSQAPPRRRRPTSISYDFDHDIGRALRHLAPPPEAIQHQSSSSNFQTSHALLHENELAPWRATAVPQPRTRFSRDDLSPPADVKAEHAQLEKRFEEFIAKAREQWVEERQASLERRKALLEGRGLDTDGKGKSPV